MRPIDRFTGIAALALLTMAVTGCPKTSNSGGAESGGGGTSTKVKVAVIPKGTTHSFWQTVKAGAEAACKEENCEVTWVGPDKETDFTEQINIVQNQVSGGAGGIVLAATDSEALVRPVKEAMEKGVPVVTIDSGLKDNPSLCYIATDNVEGGRRAADELAKLIGEKGKVGLMPFLKGAGSSDEREKGFLEGIKKYPGITVAITLYNESDAQKATEQTLNMLTAHPDLNGIFAANEPGGVGASNALKQKKLEGKVKLVAYDTSEDELKAFNQGIIQALIVQNPYQMGFQGVKTVMKAIRKQPIDKKFIDSGVTVVTKENFDTPDVQKLINPGT
jgi:ribose transport system substrate-binding protein